MNKITCFAVGVTLLVVGCSQSTKVSFIELKDASGKSEFAVFLPDGKKIITVNLTLNVDDAVTRIWDAESGKQPQELKGRICLSVLVNFDASFGGGKILMIDSDSVSEAVVYVWDIESGKKLHSLEGGSPFFSSDGKKVATVGGTIPRRVARIWDVESGKELQKLEVGDPRAFSPDGKNIV